MAEHKVPQDQDLCERAAESSRSEHALSRKKFLASLGVAGVALASSTVLGKITQAAAMGSDSADPQKAKNPTPMNADFVIAVTLQDLRTYKRPDDRTVYYVTDRGKEGPFYYDPNDTSSSDNTGTIVVSSSGARFKRMVQGNIEVGWFGAAADGNTDDAVAIQAAFQYAASIGGGTLEFLAGKTYKLSSTIEVGTRTIVRGNNAVIVFTGNQSVMFHTFKSTDIYFEKLLCVDNNQSNTAFYLEGAGAGNINNYCRYIDLFAVQLVNFKLGLRSRYARTWKMNRCNFYVGSGVLIETKSVEINITDCVIYGMTDAPTDTYAIKTDTDTGEYPEGIMVNGCTLDNFGRTVWLRNVFVFQLTNSYVASNAQAGRFAFYADKGIGSHCQDITVSNVEFNGNGVCFRPGTPSPVLYKAVFSNCLFENVRDSNIELGRFAFDISFDNLRFECFPSTNAIVAVCEDVNQRVQFNHLITNDFPVFGILVKGRYSTVAIRGFDYNGGGSALYLEQSTFVESVRSVYADSQTRDYLHKYVQLPAGTYGPGQSIGGVAMNIADGQKGTITINGTLRFTGEAPNLQVVVPDNSLVLPEGALSVKPGVSGQYLSVTIPFQVAANNGIYSAFGINKGYFGLQVDPASPGSVEFDSGAYISIRLED